MPSTPTDSLAAERRLHLTRRELAVIVGVWALYAFLSIASRLFDERGNDMDRLRGPIMVALLEALGWALLTPPILLLADRLGVDARRGARLLAFAGVGIAVAATMGWASTELRHAFGPPPGSRGPRGGRGGPGGGRGGPPFWFAFLNALVLYLTVLAAGVARSLSRRYHARREEAARREARLEAQLAEARLDALRRQLDPHFLFNTLNAVSALVERDPRGVRRMIARLSDLLRFSFEGADRAVVPLREELALLSRYVEIMQVRFQGRLTVETTADDAALDVLVPTLVLQPLVENAIRHGVERIAGPGNVAIDARLEGESLVLRVTDNGPGVAPDAPTAGSGVGLRNTVARLEQLYGAAQRFTIAAAPQGGTVAEIRLPRRIAPSTPTPDIPARPVAVGASIDDR
ncbi:sensor histidine kinase [Roseisolibacter agri]|uniref:histidine kinase n=1 Tax=Roseisolibacter agri TaxID=2014610 RepID=A0AA37Q6H4_9BACT|nr:histidine kinase [Roseisolibacter agri]GLC23896.1 ATPase [Roseisolibacter agri]